MPSRHTFVIPNHVPSETGSEDTDNAHMRIPNLAAPMYNTYQVSPIPYIHDESIRTAHGMYLSDGPRRPSMKGRLCPELSRTGACGCLPDCPYSHTVEEARRHNQNFKTKICEFAANGFCKRANQCRFAHSFSELVPEYDQSPQSVHGAGVDLRSVSAVSGDTNQGALSPSTLSSNESSVNESHVCYMAPPKQRKAFRHRPRIAQTIPVMVPSAFHYVDHNDKRRRSASCLVGSPGMGHVPGQSHQFMFHPYRGGAVMYAPMMYNMMMPHNVVYED